MCNSHINVSLSEALAAQSAVAIRNWLQPWININPAAVFIFVLTWPWPCCMRSWRVTLPPTINDQQFPFATILLVVLPESIPSCPTRVGTGPTDSPSHLRQCANARGRRAEASSSSSFFSIFSTKYKVRAPPLQPLLITLIYKPIYLPLFIWFCNLLRS